jgi:hypothetical protein
MKRKLLLAAAIATVALLALRVPLRTRPRPITINYSTYELLKPGMHEKEVEAILGAPAGDYSTRAIGFVGSGTSMGVDSGGKEWRSNEGIIIVWFDERGAVTGTRFNDVITGPAPSVLERVEEIMNRLLWSSDESQEGRLVE